MSHITEEQRYKISFMLSWGFTQKEISEKIGKHKSVVSREIRRNRSDKGKYSFSYAQMCVSVRKERYEKSRKFTSAIQKRIEDYITEDWSPEQIHGYCCANGIAMVSIERIYQHIRADKKQGGMLSNTVVINLKTEKDL